MKDEDFYIEEEATRILSEDGKVLTKVSKNKHLSRDDNRILHEREDGTFTDDDGYDDAGYPLDDSNYGSECDGEDEIDEEEEE